MSDVSRLTRVVLDSKQQDHFVFIDKTQIKAVQVQLPIESNLHLSGDRSLGVLRVFVEGMSHPFQFTRDTKEEIEELVTQLV